MAIKKLGHVGIYAKDFPKMRDFYSKVIGLHVSDQTENAAFMTSDPKREHHEFVVFRSQNEKERTSVQQVSFSCESLEDVRNYYHRLKEADVRFSSVTSHGNAIGLYFYDPEDNRIEVYWTTPWEAHQPYAVAVDMRKPLDEIKREVEADVRQYAETGHIDRASFEVQKQQFIEAGIRV